MEERNHDLLRKINGKLAWALFFLVCITLNTCSAADRLDDLFDRREEPAPAVAPAPAAPPAQPAQPAA
jgi:hypothetical protein